MTERTQIAPYMAVGLSTIVHGIGSRKDIERNLQIVEDGIHAAISIIGINMPVRLIALAEGALTGFTDEIFDIPHVTAARDLFIDIPGPETERLAVLARHYGTYIVAQCKARWPEVIDDRFFNTLFVISPQGEIVHKAAKNHLWCRERSCAPHDVYDRWVELFGDGIDAFYPVLRTEDIGNIGTICCSDGEYPEAVRALAFNGAEVVYRPSEAVPMTQLGMEPGGTWLLQNRAHAHFNNVYMVCPNVGPVYVHPKMEHPYDIGGGNSHVVDYQGNVLGHTTSGANTFVAGIIDIEALRQFRTMNLNSNWMKDLRTELFRHMYEEPVHPKNLWLDTDPQQHADVDEIYRANIEPARRPRQLHPAGPRLSRRPLHRPHGIPRRGRLGKRAQSMGPARGTARPAVLTSGPRSCDGTWLASMDARSASVSPAAASIRWTIAFFPRPYSSISAAVAPTCFLTAAYCSRRAGSARRVSRTARWLRSASEPSTTTYVFVPVRCAGSLKAQRSGIPSSPSGAKPRPVRTPDAAATSCSATTMSQSMTGLAARPGTEVLPTCSMATTGTSAAAIAAEYSSRSRSNRLGQSGSYSATRIT